MWGDGARPKQQRKEQQGLALRAGFGKIAGRIIFRQIGIAAAAVGASIGSPDCPGVAIPRLVWYELRKPRVRRGSSVP
jgi:hypothetical protein